MRWLLLAIAMLALLPSGPSVAIADGQSADGRTIPELGRNLPQNFDAADAEFKNRVRQRFAAGEAEQDVVDTLLQQGFKLGPDGRSARFEQPGWECRLVWRVFWSADAAHKIARIDGVYAGICL